MNPIEFEDFILFLRNAYGLAMYPTRKGNAQSEIVDFLFDRVGHIPGEALPWMRDRLLEIHERFPGKIHVAILDAYQQWLAAHPEKRARSGDREECRNHACEDGLLFVISSDGYRTVFRCGCGRSTANGIPVKRMVELTGMGYRHYPAGQRPGCG